MDTVRPDEIPEGFTAVDPNNPSAAAGAGDSKQAQAKAKEGQRRSILEQALTSEALARLGTLKVCHKKTFTEQKLKGVLLYFSSREAEFFSVCLDGVIPFFLSI